MLEKHIKDELVRSGKASVPGLGTFQKEKISAELDETSNSINQPKYKISFTTRADADSEAEFLNIISEKEGIDSEDASLFVKQQVDDILAAIQANGSYEFHSLGKLKESGYNNYTLESGYIEDENFGLPEKISLKPVQREPKETETLKKEEPYSNPVSQPAKPVTPQVRHVPPKKDYSLLITFLIVTLVAAGAVYYFMFYKKGDKQVAENKTEQVTDPNAGDTTETETKTSDPVETKESTTDNKTNTSNSGTNSGISSGETTITEKVNRYHVVVGGFSVKDNAERLRTELEGKGYPSRIIAPNKNTTLYRVTIGDFDTMKEALAKANTSKSEFQSAPWVLKY
jgi:cell division protein FtsN